MAGAAVRSSNRSGLVRLAAVLLLAGTALPACSGVTQPAAHGAETSARPDGWTDETHGNEVDPDYSVVFPADRVNRLEITIAPQDWALMQANMSELFGTGGNPQGELPGRPGDARPVPDQVPPDRGLNPRAPGIPRWIDMTPDNPVWVPATVQFNGLTWTNVGIRYKGNSSLRSGWGGGAGKLPLKLDFDEFEDDYPEIDNQRFYGFEQLSLSNAFADATWMRDVLAAEILGESGLPAAKTAYYEVIVDYGEGPVNMGLYVAIEVIDDTVIGRFFGDASGNIYEGDGPGVSLAVNTRDQLTAGFLKENNQQAADWSDIEALYSALHAESRLSDPTAWRTGLESVFNVDGFLQWLAIASVMQHWDTYGQMAHNFYLYHDPETGLLHWISWDHNQVLAGGSMGGAGGGRAPAEGGRNVTLGREEVSTAWPLIRYLLDDPVYLERYRDSISDTIEGPFAPGVLERWCRELAALIAPYAVRESGEAAFASAVESLLARIHQCHDAAASFAAAKAGA